VHYAQGQGEDRYDDGTRALKRRRSEDDYGDSASVYPPAQMPRTTYSSFVGSNVLQPGFGQVKQETMTRTQGTYGDPRVPEYVTRTATYPATLSGPGGWPANLQQPGNTTLGSMTAPGSLSERGPMGGSDLTVSSQRPMINYLSGMSADANYGSYSNTYQQQGSQQQQTIGALPYPPSVRTSSDSHPAMYGLQTPTSMTGTANLPSGHDTGYIPTTSSAISAGGVNAGHTPVQSQHYPSDYTTLSTPYGHTVGNYDESSPTYTSGSHATPVGEIPFSSAVPSSSLPASNIGLLGQGLPDTFYPPEESSYPTPTQQHRPNQWR
jgi:hypothetical protein